MGDTGSLTLGFILSFLSLKLVSLTPDDMVDYSNSFVLAFSSLMIPCFDVVRVFLGRIRRHKNPFLPDKTHIHHKLLAMGLSPKITMTTVVGTAILLTLINVELSKFVNINFLVFGNIFMWILLNMWMSRVIARRRVVTAFKQQ